MTDKSQKHWIIECRTEKGSTKRDLIRSTLSPKRTIAILSFVNALRKNGFSNITWLKAKKAPWFAKARKVNVEFLT